MNLVFDTILSPSLSSLSFCVAFSTIFHLRTDGLTILIAEYYWQFVNWRMENYSFGFEFGVSSSGLISDNQTESIDWGRAKTQLKAC